MAKFRGRDDFPDQEWLEFVSAGGSEPLPLSKSKGTDSWVYVRFYGVIPVTEEKKTLLLEYLLEKSRPGTPHCVRSAGADFIDCHTTFMSTPEAAEFAALGFGLRLSKAK